MSSTTDPQPAHRTAWVSWSEAAEMVGVPATTIEYYARVGRIERRERRGARPTLRRASVEEFAAWYAARRARLETQAARRTPAPLPEGEWMTSEEVAERVGLTSSMVHHLARHGKLPSILFNRRRMFDRTDVEHLVQDRERRGSAEAAWVSYARAAEIVGCSEPTISAYVARGRIAHRDGARARPSLDRTSVEEFATWWGAELERREDAKAASRADRIAPKHPDDGDVWLSTREVALMLGVTTAAINQMAARERLPATWSRGQRWFRRSHIEQITAARAAAITRRIAGR